ncbi:MAG: hypothetical protein QF724_08620 [Planctomycetota bacterium]|jgi:flagellar biosynthesis GTPase FlhF|nr:hypothetical protein [Planctomycetota bacterium]MDP6368520.1 hypothetical protein [Planctomycetota bacterium]MDP6519704.1 hypothetical protein [Planctomycetota bacterium]MDP6838985.1 hypothetical protein [Planctomycetota bacterium]MDP6955858.1 hypothetical protein [Planctomycetota bacterium]
MHIHRIRGKNLRDALERARRAHGSGAVVLTQEQTPDGGVTLAVAEQAGAGSQTVSEQRDKRVAATPLATPKATPPVTSQVARCLETSGASAEFVEHICKAVAKRMEEGRHPIDLAASEIGKTFPAPPKLPSRGITRVLSFSGLSGVGKTTCLVRLATRLVRAGRKVALATLDTHRVGAVEQLRAYAALLDVPLFKLREGADLMDYLARAPGLDVVLLDTTGHPGRDSGQLAALAQACVANGRHVAELQNFVVLPATLGHGSVGEAVAACAGPALAGCFLTKLDETRRPAPVLEYIANNALPVAFMSDSSEVNGQLHRPQAEQFADLMLRGGLR